MPPRLGEVLDWKLWRPWPFLGLIVGYCAVHLLLRLAATDTIEVDHVEQVIFAQGLAWSYGVNQPPLYTWMLLGLQELLGVGQFTLLFQKYLCVAAALQFYFLATRRMLGAAGPAALCTLSLLLLYQIGWKFHYGVTHTALLTAACCATLWLVARIRDQGRVLDYVLLGFALGVGVMAKYGFLLFAAALLGALGWKTATRSLVLTPRILASLAIAALIFAPYGWVLLGQSDALGATASGALAAGPAWPFGIPLGLWELVTAVLGFLAPGVVLVCLIHPRIFRLASRPSPEHARDQAVWHGVLSRYHVIMLGALLAMVLVGGATEFKERWMHPFLIATPILVFLRVQASGGFAAGSESARKRLRVLMALTIAFAVLVVVARMGREAYGPPLCKRCRALTDYTELAEKLRDIGFRGGDGTVIVAGDEHLAGNLRVAFPEAQVHSLRYRFFKPPPPRRPVTQCLLIWKGHDPGPEDQGRKDLIAFAQDNAGLTITAWNPTVAGETRPSATVRLLRRDRWPLDEGVWKHGVWTGLTRPVVDRASNGSCGRADPVVAWTPNPRQAIWFKRIGETSRAPSAALAPSAHSHRVPHEESQRMSGSLEARATLDVNGKSYVCYSIPNAMKNGLGDVTRLPFSLKVLLENLPRHEDGRSVTVDDIEALPQWLADKTSSREIAYRRYGCCSRT